MKVTAATESVSSIASDAVVVGCYSDGALQASAKEIDKATGGALTKLIEAKEIEGKAGSLTTVLAPAGVAASQVVVVGLGDREKLDRGGAFRAAASAAKQIGSKERKSAAFYLDDEWDADDASAAVCGAIVGCQGQDLYREKKNLFPFEELHWAGSSDDVLSAGQSLADSVSLTRRLVNEPPSKMTPVAFATDAEAMAKETGLEVEVWDEKKLEVERCGSLLAVARGSEQPPRLVILRHNGGKAGDAPLALVGKGVTFDSGGLSLKPSDSMKTMKCDMAGAATVVGAIRAIAELKLSVNVIGLVGLVENMVNGDSYKLGDVLTARSGKTIEVLNTDAEGRLVLADVLDVAVEQGAAKIIDLATLTGACVVALGLDVTGLMTNDQAWCDEVAEAAKTCGEQAWQLPMFEEYGEQIQSKVADIKNIGEGRWGGAMTAAKLLEEFVQGKPWVHMDIAGPAFLESPKPWMDAGGSGAFVRTLVEVARQWK
ncbi:MAG: leucyl aminopeptidase [Planctomycetaceae bacterium]|nr:leucyl aminopeptidase [Planctomycetaceae bacterium]